MLHGKKGFERIVWAFKNVLNSTVTWLFHDCETMGILSDDGTDRSCSGDACGVAVASLKSNGSSRAATTANSEALSDREDLRPTNCQTSVYIGPTSCPTRTRYRISP